MPRGAKNDQQRAQHHAAGRHTGAIPADFPFLRGIERVVDREDVVEPRELEHLPYVPARTGEAEAGMQALSGRVPTHQRANAAAVDRRHVAEIDEEIMVTVAQQRLDALLELLRRPPGDEPFLRREHHAAADRVLGDRHLEWMGDSSTRGYEPVIAGSDECVMPEALLSSSSLQCS